MNIQMLMTEDWDFPHAYETINHPVNSHVKLSRVHVQTTVLLVSELYLPSWARSYLDPLSVYLKVQRELAVTEIFMWQALCQVLCVRFHVWLPRCFVRCLLLLSIYRWSNRVSKMIVSWSRGLSYIGQILIKMCRMLSFSFFFPMQFPLNRFAICLKYSI